jgi:hypothetical protein
VAGGRASQFLAVPSTYSARGGHPSAKSHVRFVSIREKESFTAYADTNQDHLDVAEHLRDSNDHVENDRHELRETRYP